MVIINTVQDVCELIPHQMCPRKVHKNQAISVLRLIGNVAPCSNCISKGVYLLYDLIDGVVEGLKGRGRGGRHYKQRLGSSR